MVSGAAEKPGAARPLADLTAAEVLMMMRSLELPYAAALRSCSAVSKQGLSGADLEMITDANLADDGMSPQQRHRFLLQLEGFRASGVPATLLSAKSMPSALRGQVAEAKLSAAEPGQASGSVSIREHQRAPERLAMPKSTSPPASTSIAPVVDLERARGSSHRSVRSQASTTTLNTEGTAETFESSEAPTIAKLQAEKQQLMAKLQEMQKEADAKDELIATMRADGKAREAEVVLKLQDQVRAQAEAKRSAQETANSRAQETEREHEWPEEKRAEEKRAEVKMQQAQHEKEVREKELAVLAAKLGEMLKESPEALQHIEEKALEAQEEAVRREFCAAQAELAVKREQDQGRTEKAELEKIQHDAKEARRQAAKFLAVAREQQDPWHLAQRRARLRDLRALSALQELQARLAETPEDPAYASHVQCAYTIELLESKLAKMQRAEEERMKLKAEMEALEYDDENYEEEDEEDEDEGEEEEEELQSEEGASDYEAEADVAGEGEGDRVSFIQGAESDGNGGEELNGEAEAEEATGHSEGMAVAKSSFVSELSSPERPPSPPSRQPSGTLLGIVPLEAQVDPWQAKKEERRELLQQRQSQMQAAQTREERTQEDELQSLRADLRDRLLEGAAMHTLRVEGALIELELRQRDRTVSEQNVAMEEVKALLHAQGDEITSRISTVAYREFLTTALSLRALPEILEVVPSDDLREKAVAQLRSCALITQEALDATEQVLESVLKQGTKTSRAGYLTALEDRIGPRPEGRSWKEEWEELSVECRRLNKERPPKGWHTWTAFVKYESPVELAQNYELNEAIHRTIRECLDAKWPKDRAIVVGLLLPKRMGIGKALSEGSSRYAASTYALCDALFEQKKAASSDHSLPPLLYANIRGKQGLEDGDKQWADIEEPDRTGFRGLTSTMPIRFTRDPDCFSTKGFNLVLLKGEGHKEYELQDSDVIAIKSEADDDYGAHTAIMLGDTVGILPPSTLFRLRKIHQPGTWVAPGGAMPMVRLLECTATYRAPARSTVNAVTSLGKFSCTTVSLQYGSRSSYIRGLDDLISKPVLTMAQEFERDCFPEWRDWKGVTHNLLACWAYVNGRARKQEGLTAGTRDVNNDGKMPQDFLAIANGYIKARRETALSSGKLTQLSENHAYLTLEEVLAVRLYSGPAFQPINAFLREVVNLSDNLRHRLSRHPGLTFTATVGHLCRAIRKLAAVVTDEDAAKPLWRGVRGELPRSFYVPDEQNMICAVDMGFLSTSRNQQTPVDYMKGDQNVLWCLKPQPESDSAYHHGADISLLSQYAGEEEVLFPPCTMLLVISPGDEPDDQQPLSEERSLSGDAPRASRESLMSTNVDGETLEMVPLNVNNVEGNRVDKYVATRYTVKQESGAKSYLSINVRPYFL